MRCWKCGTELDYEKRIPFKATCDKCNAWLHVCKSCKHYCPGKPNDCLVPGTEFVADREKFNLCEDFSPLDQPPPQQSKSDPTERFRNLFG